MASRTRPGRGGEEGYTLLALVGIVTVMLIALGAAVPHWKAIADRGKEAELVARGWQYAEAIRVFQARFGRLPNQLAELVELEPRSIRQLWNDPLTGGPFLLIMEGPGGELVTVDPATGEVIAPPSAGLEESADEAGEGAGAAPPSGTATTSFAQDGAPIAGPIHGVRSRASGESYRVLFDATKYGDWEFTVERLVAATAAIGPEGLPRRVDYSSIGKRFRYPPPGGLPGANPNAVPGGQEEPPGESPPIDELPEGDDSDDEGG